MEDTGGKGDGVLAEMMQEVGVLGSVPTTFQLVWSYFKMSISCFKNMNSGDSRSGGGQ